MPIRVEIVPDGAAFEDPNAEVARILRVAADRIEAGGTEGFGLKDINGNACGIVTMTRRHLPYKQRRKAHD